MSTDNFQHHSLLLILYFVTLHLFTILYFQVTIFPNLLTIL